MFLFVEIKGISLIPEQLWVEFFARKAAIGSILGEQVYLTHTEDGEKSPCVGCMLGTDSETERCVGQEAPEMKLVLLHFETILRCRGRHDLADIVRGILFCHQDPNLFASVERKSELSK